MTSIMESLSRLRVPASTFSTQLLERPILSPNNCCVIPRRSRQ